MKTALNKFNLNKIGTHNGVFHADEITAIAMISVFRGVEPEIIRTRNPEVLNQILQDGGILIDVGGEYNPEKGIFDHHFSSNGVEGKASAGLIADVLGITKEKYPTLCSLIEEVDAQDIGVKRNPEHHYSNIIKSFNGLAPNPSNNDGAFKTALEFAVNYITALKKADELTFHYQQEVSKTPVEVVDGVRIALRRKSDNFIPATEFVGKADLVLSWDSQQNCWSLQTVPLVKGEFTSKYKIKSVDNPVFVHPAGFIAKIKDTGGDIVFTVEGEGQTKTISISPKGE